MSTNRKRAHESHDLPSPPSGDSKILVTKDQNIHNADCALYGGMQGSLAM
jgi:hypothetical protein